MSNGTQTQAVTQVDRHEVRYKPFAADEELKLNLTIIRNQIAVPAKDKTLPDDRQCIRFLMLCKARKLNPFEGDAFMVPFFDKQSDSYQWSLITAHDAFLKRGELNTDFAGMQSGVVFWPPITCKPCSGDGFIDWDKKKVKCEYCNGKGHIDEIEGDILPQEVIYDGERVRTKLIGGWARVLFKSQKVPTYRRVALAVFAQPFGRWNIDPAGMIVKCAESDALRSSFPNTLGGLLSQVEMPVQATVTSVMEVAERRPELPERIPTGTAPTPPATPRKNEKTTQKTSQERPAPVNTPPAASNAAQEPAANELPPSGGSPGPTDEQAEAAAGLAPSQTETQTSAAAADPPGAASTAPAPAAAAPPAPTGPKGDPATFKPRDGEGIPLTSVRRWLHLEAKTETELLTVLVANKAAKPGQKLNELSEAKLDNVYKARATLLTQMNQQPAK